MLTGGENETVAAVVSSLSVQPRTLAIGRMYKQCQWVTELFWVCRSTPSHVTSRALLVALKQSLLVKILFAA